MSHRKTKLLERIENGQSDTLPRFAGPWELANEIGPWRVYLIHDPCHDEYIGRQDDRNTVIAFHSYQGSWRIIGRELDHDLAMKIACGE